MSDVKVSGNLGCSDHEIVLFLRSPREILRAAKRVQGKLTVLDFRRTGFGLFRDLLFSVP